MYGQAVCRIISNQPVRSIAREELGKKLLKTERAGLP
jgi:hypothetical protein